MKKPRNLRPGRLWLLLAAAGLLAAGGPASAQVERTRVPIGDSGCNVLLSSSGADQFRIQSWSGKCADGLAEGPGTLKGQWTGQDGKPNPFTYEGSYGRGLREGFGRLRYEGTGEAYTGTYRRGQPKGWGWERNADGSTFEGQFFDGKRNGVGTFIAADGTTTRGVWSEGRLRGAREWHGKDGAYWNAVDVRPDGTGHGLLTDKGGEVEAGQLRLVDGAYKLDGPAVLLFESRSIFVGEFKAGRPNGAGTWVRKDKQNPQDAAVFGGTYTDGCMWRGSQVTQINRNGNDCRR